MLDTPILFLIFNRPDTTARVFEVIRANKPSSLYIAADGPRPNIAGEVSTCEKTRRLVIENIDWDCKVKTLFREENIGCGRAVSSAIKWFFENVEEGIIMEDDCLPNPDFFSYCTDLLERYRNNTQIMFIGATNFQNGQKHGDGSYYFSAYNHVWGWASWRSTWEKYDFKLEYIRDKEFEDSMNYYFNSKKVKKYWMKVFHKMKNYMIDTWDFQLAFSIWVNKGICIIPNVNLVSNIGFGPDATHTTQSHEVANLQTFNILPLQHPTLIKIDKEADKYYSDNYVAIPINKRIISRLKGIFYRV